MSGHGDPHEEAHGDDEHEHAHDDDHHAAPAPALDEPVTPLWLTLLGIALFLVAGITFVATRPSGKTTAELTAGAEASAAPAASVAPPAAPPNPALRVPAPAPAH